MLDELLGACPDARQPSKNAGLSLAIASRFFLPIALRRSSAWAPLKPASCLEISIACSWYRMTPYVPPMIGSRRGSGICTDSGSRLPRAYAGIWSMAPGR